MREMLRNRQHVAYPFMENLEYKPDEADCVRKAVQFVNVRNMAEEITYRVDLLARTCSCPAFAIHRTCKHIAGLIPLLRLSDSLLEKQSEEKRRQIASLAWREGKSNAEIQREDERRKRLWHLAFEANWFAYYLEKGEQAQQFGAGFPLYKAGDVAPRRFYSTHTELSIHTDLLAPDVWLLINRHGGVLYVGEKGEVLKRRDAMLEEIRRWRDICPHCGAPTFMCDDRCQLPENWIPGMERVGDAQKVEVARMVDGNTLAEARLSLECVVMNLSSLFEGFLPDGVQEVVGMSIGEIRGVINCICPEPVLEEWTEEDRTRLQSLIAELKQASCLKPEFEAELDGVDLQGLLAELEEGEYAR